METQKLDFFLNSSKFEFWLVTKSWNHFSFVNISPTLVIDTSMERSSRVLHHGNPKKCKFHKIKVAKARPSDGTLRIYIIYMLIHCRPFEGRHLVLVALKSLNICNNVKVMQFWSICISQPKFVFLLFDSLPGILDQINSIAGKLPVMAGRKLGAGEIGD